MTYSVGYGSTLRDVSIGDDTKIWHYCNLYDCRLGKGCTVGSYTEIGRGVSIGDHCKIEAGVFMPQGVTVGDYVFIGPHVCFTNDKFPKAGDQAWTVSPIIVHNGVSIGANSTILSGVTIGEGAMVGAGSIVTKDVPPGTLVYGDGAKERGTIH